MSRIRSRDTECELKLRQELRSIGLRGYRLNVRALPGTPDIVFSRWKLAVFCDSDFWHGRKPFPKSNREYWENKLRRNAERDARVNETLHGRGWEVMRFPESEILKDPDGCAKRIAAFISGIKESHGPSIGSRIILPFSS